MQGVASGLPGLASQIQALKIKKEQKKEAEKLKQEIANAISMFTSNNKEELELMAPGNDVGASPQSLSNYSVPQTPSSDMSLPKIGSQGSLSDPKLIPFLATVGAVNSSLAATLKDIFIAIDRGDITKYEQNMAYARDMIDHIASINLAGGDVNSYYGFPDLVTEESKKWFRVDDTYGKTPAANMPYEMTEQVGNMAGLNMPGEMTQTPQTPEAPKIADYTSAVNYLSKFLKASPETFEKVKAGYQKQFPNLDLSNITQEALKGTITPEANVNTPEQIQPEVVLPSGPQSPANPSLIQRGVNWIKGLAGGKQKDYTTLTETELFQQLKAADPESEEYIVLYEEAKRRGLVK